MRREAGPRSLATLAGERDFAAWGQILSHLLTNESRRGDATPCREPRRVKESIRAARATLTAFVRTKGSPQKAFPTGPTKNSNFIRT